MIRAEAHVAVGRRLAAADGEERARLAVAAEFYPAKLAQYARAELTFLGWEIDRGVLHPRTGSPWWRAINDRLLTDKMEASLGASASMSLSPSARCWQRFLAAPSGASWYLAHNHSIVSGYLEHERLARAESAAERLMMNVTLARVLFAHLLVQRPLLAAGVWGPALRPIADPRGSSVGFFLDLHNVFPRRYPLVGVSIATMVAGEGRMARLLDYGLILPKLPVLYHASAQLLGEPRLRALVGDGMPCYANLRQDLTAVRIPMTGRLVAALAGPIGR
ncbi:hypothetical protein [Nocardia sp. NPDC058633]|uniref:hypothetical protein n=1 Tax=Nocardia sp. NPDC058633 TaxID=3346568 RepID=UPI00364B970A